MNRINWQLILDKVGRIVVDSRFWVAFISILSVVFGVPELAENANSLSQQAIDWVVIVAQIVAVIVVPLGLNLSWAKRPPSGLDYKELTIDKLIETAKKDT